MALSKMSVSAKNWDELATISNDRFSSGVSVILHLKRRSGFRPPPRRVPNFDERVTLSPLSLFF